MFRFLSCRTVLSLLLFAAFVFSLIAADEPKKVAPTKEQVAQWVRDLGDDDFDKREIASKQLWEAGRLAEAALNEALKSDDAEVKRRGGELLDKFKWGVYPDTPAKIVEMIQRYRAGADARVKGGIIPELLDEGADGRAAYAKISAAEDKDLLPKVRTSAANAFVNKGVARGKNKEYNLALKDFNEALGLDPNNALAFLNRGVVWASKKNYERALKDFDEAIRLDPKRAIAYVNRGTTWNNKKEYDRAIKDFDEAVRLDPNIAGAYLERGVAWARKMNHDQAIKDFDEAIRIDPNKALAYSNRGAVWNKKKEYDHAIKDFDEAIRLDPKNAGAYFGRGVAWNKKKEYDHAIKDFDEAVRVNPKHLSALNSQAWLLGTCPDQRYRDGKKALELATKACELTDWKAPAYLDTLAAAYAETGDFDKAVEWAQKALKDAEFEKKSGDETRERLKLFKDKIPFREK
jgi:tetratricopeptide (TPR) repeat protein